MIDAKLCTTVALGALTGLIGLTGLTGCGRLLDGADDEDFGTYGADGADGADGDEGGDGDPNGGGPLPESCYDGIVQPGELCQVAAPEPIGAGIDPCSLTIADLDLDGRPDLAVPNSDFWLSPSGVHVANVLRGYGNGDFAPTEAWAAGEALPVGLAVGDFDADGLPDLATANNDAAAAYLLRNQGGMSFADPDGVAVGGTASSVAAGDLDEDGYDDLVVTTPTGVALVFGGPAPIGTSLGGLLDLGDVAMHVEVADLDDDGHLDLAVALRDNFGEAGRLVLLHGAGDGSFPEQVEHGLAGDPWWVRAGDLDMDGDLDLVIADYSVDQISIRMGNQLGGFSDPTSIAVCDGPQSVAIGDLNSDGFNDLVVGCIDADRVEVHVQTAGGQFELQRWFNTGPRPVSVQLGDLNLDGVPDVAWANQYGNSVGVAVSRN